MSCTEREKLFGYAHRLLDLREEHEVRAHLESCPTCRAAAEEYRKLDTLLEAWTPFEPSPSFDARVREAVERSGASRSVFGLFGLPGLRWMAPALVTVLVVVASVAVLHVRHGRRAAHAPAQASSMPAAPAPDALSAPPTGTMGGEEELKLYQNLSVLEDYDLLAEFDLLSELPKGETKVEN